MAKKVLVVDDEADMLNVVRYALQKAGYQVVTCDNGRNVWAAIQESKPDLMILDVMLPGIDGYSLGIKISQEESMKGIPIIVMTALEPSKTLFQKFPQVKGFITKPFKTEALLKNVEDAIGKAAN
jgi:DNA-binding response OmpR family regulator